MVMGVEQELEWINAQDLWRLLKNEKKVTEKTQIFEATKQAIKDLAEEVEVQKKKETTAVETANAKQFQSDQQAIRDKAKSSSKN